MNKRIAALEDALQTLQNDREGGQLSVTGPGTDAGLNWNGHQEVWFFDFINYLPGAQETNGLFNAVTKRWAKNKEGYVEDLRFNGLMGKLDESCNVFLRHLADLGNERGIHTPQDLLEVAREDDWIKTWLVGLQDLLGEMDQDAGGKA